MDDEPQPISEQERIEIHKSLENFNNSDLRRIVERYEATLSIAVYRIHHLTDVRERRLSIRANLRDLAFGLSRLIRRLEQREAAALLLRFPQLQKMVPQRRKILDEPSFPLTRQERAEIHLFCQGECTGSDFDRLMLQLLWQYEATVRAAEQRIRELEEKLKRKSG